MGTIEVERQEGIVVARFVNPPMNYLVFTQVQRLAELVRDWEDPAVRCVVLTGGVAGKFITHYSVEEIRALAGHAAVRELYPRALEQFHAILLGLRRLGKPVLAALNGDCMGGGFELALNCDLRIAQRGDHRIGLPEARLGILPGGTGTQLLTRIVGPARALELMLRGRVLDPDEAHGAGLVHEVAADALARALELARELAALSPRALREIKACVLEWAELPLAAGLACERRGFVEALCAPEALRAMDAYLATHLAGRRAAIEGPRRA